MQPDAFSVVLQQCRNGDKPALEALTSAAYATRKPGQTLPPTTPVHLAYMRLARRNPSDFASLPL
ncbi:MAG: hypothetical protein ABSF64_13240 [Bryobacteraceae bacterium]|jgi:hypothetical protein